LITALVQQRAEDPTVKSVVVSQFTSFLTLLETPLRYSAIDFNQSNYSIISPRNYAQLETLMRDLLCEHVGSGYWSTVKDIVFMCTKFL